MQNLLEELIRLLTEDERLVSEGKLLKNKVIELALNMDAGLIKLLLKNESIKRHFFAEIGGVLVFDKIKFQKFVSNKQFLPDSYTAFKNKIGLVNENGDYLSESREVVLAWPYKDCVLEGGQTKEDQKRDEIFWNETLAPDEIDRLLAPKVWTNFKRYDKDGEHALSENEKIDFSKENLIIKGNNLLALHSLYKRFAGKVKLIYIDPPYNTEKDSFRYNDNFNHSSWLTFMKNRLEFAKNLLKEEGIIIVQCDDNEAAYLKVLMDQVFYPENYIVTMYFQVRYAKKTLSEDNDFQKVIEQGLIYAKNNLVFKPNKGLEEYKIDKFEWEIKEISKGTIIELGGRKVEVFKQNDYEIIKVAPHKNALKETWATGSLLRQKGSSGEFLGTYISPRKEVDGLGCLYKVYGIGEDGIGYRYFTGPKKQGATKGKFYSGIPLQRISELNEGNAFKEKPISNYFDFAGDFGNCRHEGNVDISGGKKPEILINTLIKHFSNEQDIVLDFHLGSGTTCAVAHKMGRQYIGIEQLDYGENDSVVRLKNVINGDQSGISKPLNWQGGGAFIYCEIMEHNETYINRIQKAKTTKELLAIWEEMQEKAFISYKIDPKTINANISEFESLSLDEQKRFLTELLDKNQLYVNYSEIDDEDYKVSDTDKKLNRIFYGEK